jgi:hypothetical protein
MKSLTILSAAAAAQQHREIENGGLWLIWSGDLNPALYYTTTEAALL